MYLACTFEIGNIGLVPFVSATAIVGAVAPGASAVPAWRASLVSRWSRYGTSQSVWQAARRNVERTAQHFPGTTRSLTIALSDWHVIAKRSSCTALKADHDTSFPLRRGQSTVNNTIGENVGSAGYKELGSFSPAPIRFPREILGRTVSGCANPGVFPGIIEPGHPYILNVCSSGTRGRPRPTRRNTACRSMTP
jgi:hypothetical protein